MPFAFIQCANNPLLILILQSSVPQPFSPPHQFAALPIITEEINFRNITLDINHHTLNKIICINI